MIINPYAFGGGTPTDPSFASVISLIHFNEATGFTGPYSDQIANRNAGAGWANIANTPTIPQTLNDQVKFGACSFSPAFIGCQNADHADWDFGSGDYTVEAWFRVASLTIFHVIFGQWNSASGNKAPFLAYINSSNQPVFGATTTNASWDFLATSATTVTTGTWYHIAICRSGSTVRGFLDGTECVTAGTLTGAVVNNADSVSIGNVTNNPGTLGLDGWIDDFRATKGVARYTANFTPPTAQFPDS